MSWLQKYCTKQGFLAKRVTGNSDGVRKLDKIYSDPEPCTGRILPYRKSLVITEKGFEFKSGAMMFVTGKQLNRDDLVSKNDGEGKWYRITGIVSEPNKFVNLYVYEVEIK